MVLTLEQDSELTTFMKIDASPDWHQASGSVDFQVLVPGDAASGVRGLLSRDYVGETEDGHLSIFKLCDNRITVRLQNQAGQVYLCSSAPITPDRWTHVGVNFGGTGGLQLFVDGSAKLYIGEITCEGTNLNPRCVTPAEALEAQWGLDGNNRPWVLGATCNFCDDDLPGSLSHPFIGSFDDLRFSRVRRDFSLAR